MHHWLLQCHAEYHFINFTLMKQFLPQGHPAEAALNSVAKGKLNCQYFMQAIITCVFLCAANSITTVLR